MKLARLFQGGKVATEEARIAALQNDRNVAGLIQMLDSDVRGATKYSIVRGDAAAALGRIGDPRAIPYVTAMRHDPEEMVRFNVMWALGRLNTKEVEDALREGMTDESALVRMTAAEALGIVGAVDAIPLLRVALDSDPDPEVRLCAVESLMLLGDADPDQELLTD